MLIKGVLVTDHALLRYLERVRGIDLDKFREEIANLVRPGLGGTKISTGGWTYCLNGNVVKSVIAGKSPMSAMLKTAKHNGKSTRFRAVE